MTNKVINSIKYVLFLSFLICDVLKFRWTLNMSNEQDCLGLLDSLHTLSDCRNWPSKVLFSLSKALPEFLDLWSKDSWSYINTVQSRNLIWNQTSLNELSDSSTDLPWSFFHQVKLFLGLICEAKTGPTSNLLRLEIGFGTPRLSACAEWILNFVQEFGVRTDLQRS